MRITISNLRLMQPVFKKNLAFLPVLMLFMVFLSYSLAAATGDIISVKDYGAVGNGVHDDTSNIQNAINTIGANSSLYFPTGIYKVTSTITVSQNRVHLLGAGVYATQILFAPSSNSTCFKFSAGASVLYQGSVRNMAFYSSDTTYTKTAIELIDTSTYLVEDIVVGGSLTANGSNFWGGNGSIGLRVRGRETGCISRINIYADRPILISPNPNNSISIDHFDFMDTYLGANGNPCVEIESGVNLTHSKFIGYNAWVLGTYGLYWNDTTTTMCSYGLILSGVRTEQGTSANAWMVYINHHYGLHQVSISDCYGGIDRNGYYLRNCQNVSFNNVYHVGTSNVALDVDSTVCRINMDNCFWQTGSTVNMIGQRLLLGTPKSLTNSPLPPNAIYINNTVGDRGVTVGGAISEYTVDIPNNTVAPIAGTGACGTLFVTDSEGLNAIFALKGTYHATAEISDPWGVFSNSAGSASTTNVYWSTANSQYEIENKRGVDRKYKITLIGSYTSF